MKLVANETFHNALISQYRDLIQEAIIECESDHRTRINLGKLNSKLHVILKAAAYDGIPLEVVNELIEEAVPSKKAA